MFNLKNLLTMKKNLLILSFIVLIASATTFSQSILNGSFENWSQQVFYEEPDSFQTSNSQIYMFTGSGNVSKVTDSHSGSYAAKLETISSDNDTVPGALLLEIPYTDEPDSLTGFVKYNILTNDTAFVVAIFYSGGNYMGGGSITFYGTQLSYAKFGIPFYFMPGTPDTLRVYIFSSNINGTQYPGSCLYVDGLEFIGSGIFPNGDIENWTPVSTEEPDDWVTINSFIFQTGDTSATKTTDACDGTYALKLRNVVFYGDTLGFITNGWFGENGPEGGKPVHQNPEKLTGYYKYFPDGLDTGFAYLASSRYDTGLDSTILLDSNMFKLEPASTYTYFEVPLTYNLWPYADTVNISFASGNITDDGSYIGLNSVLFIDGLGITYYPVSVKENNFDKDVIIYPNPGKDVVSIELNPKYKGNIKVQLFDLQGRKVIDKNYTSNKQVLKLDVSELYNGLYFYNIKTSSENITGKIIINP
jgi:hypothetical protein